MRATITTTVEVAGLALVNVAVFLAAPLWAGLGAVGVTLVVVGAAEGRK